MPRFSGVKTAFVFAALAGSVFNEIDDVHNVIRGPHRPLTKRLLQLFVAVVPEVIKEDSDMQLIVEQTATVAQQKLGLTPKDPIPDNSLVDRLTLTK